MRVALAHLKAVGGADLLAADIELGSALGLLLGLGLTLSLLVRNLDVNALGLALLVALGHTLVNTLLLTLLVTLGDTLLLTLGRAHLLTLNLVVLLAKQLAEGMRQLAHVLLLLVVFYWETHLFALWHTDVGAFLGANGLANVGALGVANVLAHVIAIGDAEGDTDVLADRAALLHGRHEGDNLAIGPGDWHFLAILSLGGLALVLALVNALLGEVHVDRRLPEGCC